ncbi:MAG: hypothetical protein K2M57_06570 [Paramuribaculum sp.]|nr:hypothetical protein [Paramuribaculum sp.]
MQKITKQIRFIRIDRIALAIFAASFALLIPSVTVAGYADEIAAMLLFLLATGDAIVNGNWRKYRLLWVAVAIMGCYAVYSVIAKNYNTASAILADSVIQVKSVVCLAVFMGIKPRLTETDRAVLKWIAITNCLICTGVLMMSPMLVKLLLGHVSYGGINIFLSVAVYLLCSTNRLGDISTKDKLTATLMLTGGVLCTRAKFYGEYVIFIAFMVSGDVNLTSRLKPKYILTAAVTLILTVAAGWDKLTYYFLSNAQGRFDPEAMESFARPVLYATGAMIMIDQFPLGSGLASFASYKSSTPYSGLYAEYGIDKVYGLSEAYPSFICDAYYPSLAQMGVAGVALFTALIVYVMKQLLKLIRRTPALPGYFTTGCLCVCFLLIESIANTTMVQAAGVTAMSVIGICCGETTNENENG